MTKQIIIYILLAACVLSACRSDYYDFVEPVNDATDDELTLTVSTSDIVVSDGITSRADDNGSSTVFYEGECVGLIALDKEGRLLADNVPYKYNGKDWVFDADNTEKERVFYDAAMSTYIVYYPYDTSVDGVKDVSSLKSKSVFAHQINQHSEEVYRHCDLMVWTQTENLKKDIYVKLGHVYNSFSLDVKLNWELGLPSENNLEYRPLRKALVDFKVCLEDGTPILNDTIDYTFNAEDRSFRYILKDNYKGKITWRYTYRGESVGGESDVSATGGVRYVQHTITDVSRDKAEAFDYYSYKNINGNNYGFVMPWDAAECFEQYHPVGIVFYVGQHSNDKSDYTDSGIGQQECHGYVVALSDAFIPNPSDPTQSAFRFRWTNPKTPADTALVTGKTDTNDWGGYENLINMRNFKGSRQVVDETYFPAAYACETYVGSDGKRGSAVNTSGWFLPTYNMLYYIMKDTIFDQSYKNIREYADNRIDTTLFDENIDGYWSSTESNLHNTYIIKPENPIKPDGTVAENDTIYHYYKAYYKSKLQINSQTFHDKQTTRYVRAVLAF